tara:strand:- start:231529 stop:233394 length:1866 start_codon:yes stop_codon:yes gene_type:complete
MGIFKDRLNIRNINLKALLFCVLLFVAIVPLAVHIYSINNYSDFVIEKDRSNKQELIRNLVVNTVVSKQREGTVFVSDMIIEEQQFISSVLSKNTQAINTYFESFSTQAFINNNIVNSIGFMIYDENGINLGQAGKLGFDPKVIDEILLEQQSLDGNLKKMANGYFRADGSGEPKYLLVYPIAETDFKSKLIVVTSFWDSLVGVAQLLQADIEIRGSNGELFYKEKYITAESDALRTTVSKDEIDPISIEIPYDAAGNYLAVSVFAGNNGILAKSEDLKYITIVVAIISILIVWIMGTYFLKAHLFKRIEHFSTAMKNIVEGKAIDDMPVDSSDEFQVLANALQKVIDYNEDRKRIKHDLEDAISEAKVANIAKSDFLANMSHELRTPLNAIIGFSELLADDDISDYSRKRTREYAIDIRDSGRHLLSIINDILDLSKIEAGKMRFYEDEVDIFEICEASMRILKNQANNKNLKVILNLEDDIPLIMADERMMQQILTNLLSNAVKFTLDGGNIWISAIMAPNNDLLLSVTDNGIGIEQDKIEDIMQPFHQVETSYAKTEVGTGLGLSLVKAFVEMHNGTITVESELGKQTMVTVRIPKERVVLPAGDASLHSKLNNISAL